MKIKVLSMLATLALIAIPAHAIPISSSKSVSPFFGGSVGSFTSYASPNRYSNVVSVSFDYAAFAAVKSGPGADAGGNLGLSVFRQGARNPVGPVSQPGGGRSGVKVPKVPGRGTVPVSVPEPGALWLLGAGLVGLGLARRRSRPSA